MPALFLALLTCTLATAGGRPALLTARLAARLGGGAALLAAGWITAAATSALAAWAAAWFGLLMAPAAKAIFVAFALAACAVELLLVKPPSPAAEPTRSLGAISLVLFAGQLTDAARFLVLALALATASPVSAGLGGAIGSGAALTAAWALGNEWEEHLPLTAIRRIVAALFLLAAVIVALAAKGVIG
jgi:Ca2+/H+ antiporter, TMEM165/GDT1 family